MRGTVRSVVVAVVVAVAVVGCSSDDRPSDAAWAAEWEREQLIAPTEAQLLDGGNDVCDELVGRFREVLPRLTPTPTEALDDAVCAWVDHAESLVFDCPDDPAEIERRLDELAVLAAEVDAGLAADAD